MKKNLLFILSIIGLNFGLHAQTTLFYLVGGIKDKTLHFYIPHTYVFKDRFLYPCTNLSEFIGEVEVYGYGYDSIPPPIRYHTTYTKFYKMVQKTPHQTILCDNQCLYFFKIFKLEAITEAFNYNKANVTRSYLRPLQKLGLFRETYYILKKINKIERVPSIPPVLKKCLCDGDAG